MATLAPFRALRPTPASAARVAAVPYDVVNAEEARALAAGNSLSFLHVSRAEIDLPPDTNPYSDEVYAKAVENFSRLKAQAPLIVEEAPSLYVYRLRMGTHVQTGVAGTFSIAEYERDAIRKHERTRRDKEDDRTRHIAELRAQTGPVFLTYVRQHAIDTAVEHVTRQQPLFEFTAPDDIQHTIWRAADIEHRQLIDGFAALESLYIADGHHRAASAARARKQVQGSSDTFLAVAFPDTQMQVLPYNRVIKDLNGRTSPAFLDELRRQFVVTEGPASPSRKGDVAMFLDGTWYTLQLGPAPQHLAAADQLDVTRLQQLVLTPLLGIGDVRSDKRIDFVGGARGTTALESLVRSGQHAVAFSMYPVGVADLMRISDAGGIMPPKSTWFEPKLRDGLLSHVI